MKFIKYFIFTLLLSFGFFLQSQVSAAV